MALDIDTVYRDNVVKGDIHSAEHQPDKAEIRALLKGLFGSASSPSVVKKTKAALDLITPASESYGGMVLDDPDPAKNGYYYRSSGAWVRGRSFPDTFARVDLDGSGTTQTGIVNAGVNPATTEVFFAKVDTPNTGALTLSIGGETARPVINLAGNPLSPGEWTGMVMFYLTDDGDYQMLIDAGAAASASQSASNAAAILADMLLRYLGPFPNDAAAAAAAGSPVEGQLYYNTTDGKFRVWNGTSWQDQSTGLGDGEVTTPKLAPEAVTEPKLAGALTSGLERVMGSRSGLAALDVSRWVSARLNEGGRSGLFDLLLISSLPSAEQAKLAADDAAEQGVYVVSTDDDTYVWKRRFDGPVMAEWFGAVPWVVGGSQDSTIAFQAAATFADISGSWRWKGRHRITGKVTIPDHQIFGSFGNATSIVPQLVATPAAFTGPNTSVNAGKVDNAVFFDATGVAFELGQAAQPEDFTIYGRGYIAVDGSKSMNAPSPTTGDWHGQTAFKYGKYIKPTNVTVTMFQIAFDSNVVGAYSGNYYSSIMNCTAESCCTVFQVGTTPSYNTEIHGGRYTCGRFGQFDTSLRNWKMFGGSIEGFSAVSYIRDDSEISFFGTYFETKHGGTLDQFLSTFHSRVVVNFVGCLVYMDNFKTLFGAATTTPSVVLNSHGNKFMIPAAANDTAASHIIYAMTSVTTKGGSLFGDMIVKYGTSKTTAYVDGLTASYVPYSAATTITV